MGSFPWKDEYSVNIAEIDVQHRKFLDVVASLHGGVARGQSKQDLQKILAGLLEYAVYHFATEEQLMTRHSFPGLGEHKKEHDAFRRKIVQCVDAFLQDEANAGVDMLEYLDRWLPDHVFTMDKKYSAFLNDRGVF